MIDDHVLIRQGMQGLLKKLKRDALVLDASDCAQALRTLATNPDVDLILLDLTLPDRDGFSVLAELRKGYPGASIVVLSADQDPGIVTKALELGARGYIPKSAQGSVIVNALRLVISGSIYVPPEILARAHAPPSAGTAANAAALLPADIGLTERQLAVLALVMQGKNNKTICRILNLAEPTVKNHVTAILKALKVSNRMEAVVVVNRMGWKVPEIPSG
ncbi:MAG: response regulator [Xanthobacteraceae bacterium]